MIEYNAEKRLFHLSNDTVSYIFYVNPYGYLENIYFGSVLQNDDYLYLLRKRPRGHSVLPSGCTDRESDLNQTAVEYPTYGQGDYRESAVDILYADGSRITDLHYEGYSLNEKKESILPKCRGGETLVISLYDSIAKIRVLLSYTIYKSLNVVLRSAQIINCSDRAVYLERAYSFSLDVPNENYERIALFGAPVRERMIEKNVIPHGVSVLGSKRGISSPQCNPFMAVCERNTSECYGRVYGFQIIYSGNFELKTERDENEILRICGGISSYDFSWKLKPLETFDTPEAVLVFSENGLGELSRCFHDLYREYLINSRFVDKPRPIVLNSWEAVYMNFCEDKLFSIIDEILKANVGIDTFVLDDGWFGHRDDDKSSLGDWSAYRKKLPHGLKIIADRCHKNGLHFGLWFEPEMVSEDSELNRAHPDWKIQVHGREPCLGRFQYVLDITRTDVRDYIKHSISALIREVGIDYIKWDMNRCLTENYSLCLLPECEKEFSHRYILGLYDLLRYFTEQFPNLLIEGCSSGGGRFDAGILAYCPQIWTSDNTDAYCRTLIQYGTSLCYPLSSMSCHVSACPNHQVGRITPIVSRCDVASLGATGCELDLSILSDAEKERLKNKFTEYRLDEHLLLNGDLYRLTECGGDFFAEEIVSKDRRNAKLVGMVALAMPNPVFKRVRLSGLEKNAEYYVPEDGRTYMGNTLMKAGYNVPTINQDFQTFVRHFIKVDQ